MWSILLALRPGGRPAEPCTTHCKRAGPPQSYSWCDHAVAWPCGTDRPGSGLPCLPVYD